MITQIILKFPKEVVRIKSNENSRNVIIDFEGYTLRELINQLDEKFGNIKDKILEQNELKPFLNLFIGSKNINNLNGLETQLKNGDIIRLLLARAGG